MLFILSTFFNVSLTVVKKKIMIRKHAGLISYLSYITAQ